MAERASVGAALVLVLGTIAATPAPAPKHVSVHAKGGNTEGQAHPATGTPSAPAPSPSPAIGEVDRFWGFASTIIAFDRTHGDSANGAWAVRAFVETGSDDAVLATLVDGPASHPHLTLYARPARYGGRKGIVISIALLGKDPAKSDALAAGEHVSVRVVQRRARWFKPPLQFRGETQ